MKATAAQHNGEASMRRMMDLLADAWTPVRTEPYVLRGNARWSDFFPVGTARQFDLGRGRLVVAVCTSAGFAMLGGRRVQVAALDSFASRPCVASPDAERGAA